MFTNAMDYIKWRGDITFDVDHFNEVDLFLCSQLAIPDYTGIVPDDDEGVLLKEAADKYFSNHSMDVDNLGLLQPTDTLPMLKELSKCERFSKVKLAHYFNQLDISNTEQFCGLCVILPNGTKIVVFRGTDDTITGWKEDFNIAAQDIIPAQNDALEYLERVAGDEGDIFITGHSKGGNLAVYAAVHAANEIKDRIGIVVNWDGPGFQKDIIDQEKYSDISDRIYNMLSQNSLIGTLLYPLGSRVYLNSSVFGPMAHDGFNWEVQRNMFTRRESLSKVSTFFEKALKDTLGEMDCKERQSFIDEFFDALESTDAVTVSELYDQGAAGALKILRNLRKSPKVKDFGTSLFRNMADIYKSNPAEPRVMIEEKLGVVMSEIGSIASHKH